MYDKNSFLQGIAVGKALKGWYMVGGGTGYLPPVAWKDPNVYSYFYLNYQYPIDVVSLSIFKMATTIFYKQSETVEGYITPTRVEQFNETTFKVYADMSKATYYFLITGILDNLIRYKDGGYVPYYSTICLTNKPSLFIVTATDDGLEYDRSAILSLSEPMAPADEFPIFRASTSEELEYDRQQIKEMRDDLSTKI